MTAVCLSAVFVTRLDPTSQIVICFLFAQPLVCKLLSVNQATNYTAAAAEWNHSYLRGSSEFKNVTNCRKRWVMAAAFLFILKYPGPISSLSDRHVKKQNKTEKAACSCQADHTHVETVAFRKFTWHFLGSAAEAIRAPEVCG